MHLLLRYLQTIIAINILLLFFITAQPAESNYLPPPKVTADAAILIDASTGQVLYEKNADQLKAPASTTKIMTAILALEGGKLDEIVTVSKHAASVGEASLYLQQGEKLTLRALLYGALLESGNDACVAIAEHIGGNEENFILLMNQKAKLIGALSTSFKNTNGLPEANHYTTARDLATIARYALCNQVFKQIVATPEAIIESSIGKRYLKNTNRLLTIYNGADGVKTGTTVEAGDCLVASATRDGRQLISVVLHSQDRWRDSIALLDYGFKNYVTLQVIKEGAIVGTLEIEDGTPAEIKAVASSDLNVVVPKGEEDNLEIVISKDQELTAPVLKGQAVGLLIVKHKGNVVGQVELVADSCAEKLSSYRLYFKKGRIMMQ